jgi:hypothetical protein
VIERAAYFLQGELLSGVANGTLWPLLQVILLKIVLLHPEARVAEVVLRLGESPNSIAVHVVAGMAEAAEQNLVDFFDFWVETDLAVVVAGQTIDLFDSSGKHESLLF